MTVTVVPWAIGDPEGPKVYILDRKVGRHSDVEQMPDEIKDDAAARAFAAKRWRVKERDVQFKSLEVIPLVDADQWL